MSTTPGDASERPESSQSSEPQAERVASATPPESAEAAAPADAAEPAEAAVSAEAAAPTETASSHSVAVRRAPKYQTFLLIGVIAGLIAAMILTFAFQRSPEEIDPAAGEVYFSPGTVFGFLLLICIPLGIAIFGLLAWVIDISNRKKTHTVQVDKVDVRVSEPQAATPAASPSTETESAESPKPEQEDNL